MLIQEKQFIISDQGNETSHISLKYFTQRLLIGNQIKNTEIPELINNLVNHYKVVGTAICASIILI